MKLRVIWTGKTKNPHLAKLCDDYLGRIHHFLPIEIADVKEAKLPASARRE
jgi:23S rRNA pseudoU1915 N3-methylase RlmH